MNKLLHATQAGRSAKAVCLTCRCKILITSKDGEKIEKYGNVDFWFPKGKDWPEDGHVKQEGDDWYARTWIIESNEKEGAERYTQDGDTCTEFEILVVGEDATSADYSETTDIPETKPDTPPPRGIEEPVSEDDLPF